MIGTSSNVRVNAMKITSVLNIFLVVSTSLINVQAGWENIIMTTQKFINCPRNTSYPNPFNKLDMQKNGVTDGLIINGELEVTDVVSHGAIVETDMVKCLVATDDNSCKVFHTFLIEFCAFAFTPNNKWNDFVRAIKNFGPCPIKPGIYPVVDMQMDFNSFGPWRLLTNPEQYIGHWKMIVKFKNGDVLETCLEIEGDVKKRRRKSNKFDLPLKMD